MIVRNVKVSTSINCHAVDRKTDGFCTTTICWSIVEIFIASRDCRRNDFLITACTRNFHNFARVVVVALFPAGRPVHRAIVANCQRTATRHQVGLRRTIGRARKCGGDASRRALHHYALAIRNVISVTSRVVTYRFRIKRHLRIQFISNFS